jgi:glycosyltransferase involved in cell wall biosynthesis
MKFTIVTPCLNAAAYIEETAASVLQQSAVQRGEVALEYIVCDGGSSDGTLAILERLRDPRMRVLSQPDGGMYDALARGLRLAGGEVVAYLNAGDYYQRHALAVVRDVFATFPACRWLTGYAVEYAASGAAVRFVLPFRYRPRLIRCAAYGGLGTWLPFLQQESTFWRRELMERVDLDRLSRFRLAGDYYLWRCFAEAAEPHIVSAHLGGFRIHPGQLSSDVDAYRAEMRSAAEAPGPLALAALLWDALWWKAPQGVKKVLNPRTLHLYDHAASRWD